jgi:hypothetical protein
MDSMALVATVVSVIAGKTYALLRFWLRLRYDVRLDVAQRTNWSMLACVAAADRVHIELHESCASGGHRQMRLRPVSAETKGDAA